MEVREFPPPHRPEVNSGLLTQSPPRRTDAPTLSRIPYFLLLIIISLAAGAVLFFCTPAGVGLANDSVAYIAGARSILQGTGYSDIWLDSSLEPITHYPPLLSLTLAAIGLLGVDPLRGARILNILLFGANTALLGLLGFRMAKSHLAGLLLAALFALNASLLRIHVYAMSEPLFIFFSLLSFLVFDVSLENRKSLITRYSLLITGFLTALAFLTRYSGLALLATFLLSIFFFQSDWRSRLTKMAQFLTGAIPPLAAWFLRNKLVAGNATNRTFQYHPITVENIQPGIYNFSQFLMPIEDWRRALVKAGAIEWLLLILGLILLIWLTITAWKMFFQSPNLKITQSTNFLVSLSTCLPFTTALYIFAYLSAVLFSMSFFDASTKLQPRILAPIYVSLMVLFVGVLKALTTTPLKNAGQADTKSTKETLLFFGAQNSILRGPAAFLVVCTIGLSVYSFVPTVAGFREAGQGYASWQWRDSVVMAELKKLPADVAIYTNTPPAVYLVTGRASRVLPTPIDPVDDRPRGDYEQNVAQMRADLLSGKAVLSMFETANLEDSLGMENIAELTAGLTVLEKAQGDILYGK